MHHRSSRSTLSTICGPGMAGRVDERSDDSLRNLVAECEHEGDVEVQPVRGVTRRPWRNRNVAGAPRARASRRIESGTRRSVRHMTLRAVGCQHEHVTITSGEPRWADFSGLLQRGVFCPLAEPCSVGDFLTGQLAFDPDYVRDRIATVFLDGSVVDDLATATIRPGSTLTLSAVMPGLVGATLRRGGFYSAMRSEISWKAGDDRHDERDGPPGTIRLKLFNTVLREVGPTVLLRGVLIDRKEATGAIQPWCSPAGEAPTARWIALRVDAR